MADTKLTEDELAMAKTLGMTAAEYVVYKDPQPDPATVEKLQTDRKTGATA